MNKKEVLERLCALTSKVGSEQFNEEYAHDCFCGNNPIAVDFSFQFSEEIMLFIEKAVEEKMKEAK